jgi:hypothetical protein
MCSDWLSEKEGKYTARVLKELQAVGWASALLRRIDERGGIITSNQPLLFEARFAYELFRRGRQVQYEYPAGVGASTIEFRIANSKEWLIELVSVRESEGMRLATKTSGNFFSIVLSSLNLKKTAREEQKQSEEAEMITAQHKIGEKVLVRGQPTKFPCPGGAIHAILVDMRGYIGKGGDRIDYRQIAYGPDGVPPDRKELIHYWEDKPIRGLFETLDKHPAKAAALLQERVHLLGFIAEKEYRENEIADNAYWLPNAGLVRPALEEEIKRSFPLCIPVCTSW